MFFFFFLEFLYERSNEILLVCCQIFIEPHTCSLGPGGQSRVNSFANIPVSNDINFLNNITIGQRFSLLC